MQVTPLQTHIITKKDIDIRKILDACLTKFSDQSVLAVTSKIVSICERRFVKIGSIDKDELIKQESQYFLPRQVNKYNVSFSVAHNMLTAGAGIDESNGDGYYVLWPKNPQKSADGIREYLVNRFKVKHAGVVITDSRTAPLRWGVTGVAIAHSGFVALKDYIGTPDLFGRPFQFEKLNIADSLAASGVLPMGEGSEQTPLAVITDVPFVTFQARNPTQQELDELHIALDDDLHAPMLTAVDWQKGDQS